MHQDTTTTPAAAQHLDGFAAQHAELEAGTVERASIAAWAKLGWVTRVWTGREEWRITPQGRELLHHLKI